VNDFPVMYAEVDDRYAVRAGVDDSDVGTVYRVGDLWTWHPSENLSDRSDLPGELPTAEDAARTLWRYWSEPDPAAK
jgi:hypothetical protein